MGRDFGYSVNLDQMRSGGMESSEEKTQASFVSTTDPVHQRQPSLAEGGEKFPASSWPLAMGEARWACWGLILCCLPATGSFWVLSSCWAGSTTEAIKPSASVACKRILLQGQLTLGLWSWSKLEIRSTKGPGAQEQPTAESSGG